MWEDGETHCVLQEDLTFENFTHGCGMCAIGSTTAETIRNNGGKMPQES